jgi:CRISPR-associated protein (TIGR03984 family)
MKTQDFAPNGEEWLIQLRSEVSDGDAWLLVQGYPATGFWVVTDNNLLTPPDGSKPVLEWNLYWDIRLFGKKGEWHLWRTGHDAWRGRFCVPDEWADFMDREDALWGTQVETTETAGRKWTRLWEERGACLWVPFKVRKDNLPVRLKIRRRVDFQPGTGLAGFTDAMILGFVGVQL